eukprot:RCo024068
MMPKRRSFHWSLVREYEDLSYLTFSATLEIPAVRLLVICADHYLTSSRIRAYLHPFSITAFPFRRRSPMPQPVRCVCVCALLIFQGEVFPLHSLHKFASQKACPFALPFTLSQTI